MADTVRTVGAYAVGAGMVGLGLVTFGFGLVHLVVAIPQAVFPVAASVVLLAAGLVTVPAVRRAVRRRTEATLDPAAVRRLDAGALAATVALLGLYVAVSFA